MSAPARNLVDSSMAQVRRPNSAPPDMAFLDDFGEDEDDVELFNASHFRYTTPSRPHDKPTSPFTPIVKPLPATRTQNLPEGGDFTLNKPTRRPSLWEDEPNQPHDNNRGYQHQPTDTNRGYQHQPTDTNRGYQYQPDDLGPNPSPTISGELRFTQDQLPPMFRHSEPTVANTQNYPLSREDCSNVPLHNTPIDTHQPPVSRPTYTRNERVNAEFGHTLSALPADNVYRPRPSSSRHDQNFMPTYNNSQAIHTPEQRSNLDVPQPSYNSPLNTNTNADWRNTGGRRKRRFGQDFDDYSNDWGIGYDRMSNPTLNRHQYLQNSHPSGQSSNNSADFVQDMRTNLPATPRSDCNMASDESRSFPTNQNLPHHQNNHFNGSNRPRGQRFKQRDPKTFNGVTTEWADYLSHFEAVADWNGWSNRQKAQQLIMSFDGEAMKLLGQIDRNTQLDYDKMVVELNRHYDPKERASAYKIEFRGRVRHRNENLMKYAQELKRLVTKAYPDQNACSHDNFVLDQFIMGLGSIELRRHVQFGHPQDINQAISLAIEFEAFDTANNVDRSRKPRGELNMVRPSDDDDDDDDDEDGAVACTITDDPSGKYKSKYDKNTSCRYCKKSGHNLENCYKLKNKKAYEEREQASGDGSSNQLN